MLVYQNYSAYGWFERSCTVLPERNRFEPVKDSCEPVSGIGADGNRLLCGNLCNDKEVHGATKAPSIHWVHAEERVLPWFAAVRCGDVGVAGTKERVLDQFISDSEYQCRCDS